MNKYELLFMVSGETSASSSQVRTWMNDLNFYLISTWGRQWKIEEGGFVRGF